jgi:anti-sigma-K factor RskA
VTTPTDVHTLSGAYALDALDAEEAAGFREHLDGCDACCQEVRELRDAAARMGAVETVRPPAELRARVLASADRTPQLPPPPRGEQDPVVTPLARPERATTSRPRRRWDRLVLAAAAVLLVGGGAVGLGQVLGDSDSSVDPAQHVFQAEDARTLDEPTMNGGSLKVAVSRKLHEMAVDTSGLPKLNGGRVYQLWTVGADDTAVSVVVIDTPGESAFMDIPAAGTTVALTIEPKGGSEQPTNAPIVAVKPSAV